MSGLRIVLLGDGAWAADTLRHLAASAHTVVAVVLRVEPSDDLLERAARALGIPTLRLERINAPQTVATLAALAPDLGLSISYNQILRPATLETARHGFVNVHAGMLPRYRGRNVINWAIINGEREIGLTVHQIDAGIDTGPILLQRALPIGWTDTYGDVLRRVVAEVPGIAQEALDQIAAGRAEPQPQTGHGTYFGGRGPGDEWLDWSDTSRNIHNKIRAISYPGPGARTLFGGRTVTIWRAFADPAWPRYIATPGQVVGAHADGTIVKTGDSTLLVCEAQTAGEAAKRPRWPIGTRLGSRGIAEGL